MFTLSVAELSNLLHFKLRLMWLGGMDDVSGGDGGRFCGSAAQSNVYAISRLKSAGFSVWGNFAFAANLFGGQHIMSMMMSITVLNLLLQLSLSPSLRNERMHFADQGLSA